MTRYTHELYPQLAMRHVPGIAFVTLLLALASNGCTSENGTTPAATAEPEMVLATYQDCIFKPPATVAREIHAAPLLVV